MKILASIAIVAILALPTSIAPANAADWKDSECRKEKDESGGSVEVCRSQESIGIFWKDGSYVNGWCSERQYDIDFKGVTKSEAISWVKYYCG